jgi:hypothetical protein
MLSRLINLRFVQGIYVCFSHHSQDKHGCFSWIALCAAFFEWKSSVFPSEIYGVNSKYWNLLYVTAPPHASPPFLFHASEGLMFMSSLSFFVQNNTSHFIEYNINYVVIIWLATRGGFQTFNFIPRIAKFIHRWSNTTPGNKLQFF